MNTTPLIATPAARKTAATDVPHKLPEHVKRRLETMGLMDPDTGATRRARARHCTTCRQPVMRGIDREYGGLSRDCDPTPLSLTGEIQALTAGTRTFNLTYRGGYGYVIESRDHHHITTWPAGTNGMDVLAEHTHQHTQYETTPTQLNDRQPTPEYRNNTNDNPPF